MMRQFTYLLFLLIIVFANGCATAQHFPSRTVDGKEYFVYFVEPGNTVYAVSRMFSVEPEELLRANPEAADGLKVGQEMLIPVSAVNKREARKTNVTVAGEYILHPVQRKETLFSISRRYGVDLDLLMNLNPTKVDHLATGDTLRIPANVSRGVEEVYLEPAFNDSFVVHQVKQGETLYALSKMYNIPQDSLSRVNDGFPDGLQTGRFIVVPKYREAYLENLEMELDSLRESEMNLPTASPETYRIAMMLPFELEINDSLERSLRSGRELYILTEIALEYYRSAKLALDSLEKIGLNAEIFVYDVGDDIVKAREVMRRPEMHDMHMVFGPMHKTTFAVVSEATRKRQTYLVSPNSFSNEIFEDNPYLMRSLASDETLMRYLANFVAINHQNDNVLMVDSEQPKDRTEKSDFNKYYNRAVGTFPNAHADSLRVLKLSEAGANQGSFDGSALKAYLREDLRNILVVPSGDLAFVSRFFTWLSMLDSEKYDIQVYGMNEWTGYDNIEAAYKNRFKLRLVVPHFVDYDDADVIAFLEAYRSRYNTEPSHYDYGFRGYDLMMFFGKALLAEGLRFPARFDELESEGVSGSYRFGRSMTGREFENKSVYIIEYNNYEIRRVN